MILDNFKIDKYFEKNINNSVLIAVMGFSGVGKTRLVNLILPTIQDSVAHIRVDAYFKGDNYIYCDPNPREDCKNPDNWDSPKNFAKRELLLTLKDILQGSKKIYTRNISDKDILEGYYRSKVCMLDPKDVYLFEGINLFRLDIKYLKVFDLIFLIETSLATQIINRISRTTVSNRLVQLETLVGGYKQQRGALYQQVVLQNQINNLKQNLKVITLNNDYLETTESLAEKYFVLKDASKISIVKTKKHTINLFKKDKKDRKTVLIPLYLKDTKQNYNKSLSLLNQLTQV